MLSRTRLLIAAAFVLCLAAIIVRATPTVGQIFSVLSTGNTTEEIMTHSRVSLPAVVGVTSDDDPNQWIAHFFTSGHTGWHSHPAILLSTMISGSIEWYDAQCNKHVYNAGDSWTENTSIHDVRNVGTTNARFMITYVIAKGQPRRIDQPAPTCAAALGLE
jgi:hypothetical protein